MIDQRADVLKSRWARPGDIPVTNGGCAGLRRGRVRDQSGIARWAATGDRLGPVQSAE
jgi:hypothetical protein